MKYKAFVCPVCGTLSTKENQVLEERWDEVSKFAYDPETGECIAEERDCLGLRGIFCYKCGGDTTDPIIEYADGLVSLLVEIEEYSDRVVVNPVGEYWEKNLSKLHSLLTERFKKVVLWKTEPAEAVKA